MKYANRLTDEELREIYSLLTDSDKINELNITRNENSIDLEGYIEILEEDSNETLIDSLQAKESSKNFILTSIVSFLSMSE